MGMTTQGAPGLAAALLAALLLAPPAAAAGFEEQWKDGAPGCFARAYDAKHLAAHPRQRVTHIALGPSRLGAPTPPGAFEVTFSLVLKGDGGSYQSEGICRATAKAVTCDAEGDGGRFTIRPDGRNILIRIERLVLEGASDVTPDLAVGGDDRVLRLSPGPDSACRFRY